MRVSLAVPLSSPLTTQRPPPSAESTVVDQLFIAVAIFLFLVLLTADGRDDFINSLMLKETGAQWPLGITTNIFSNWQSNDVLPACKVEVGLHGFIERLSEHFALKPLRYRSHSFTCKMHHACLYLVSVHQTAPTLTCNGIHISAAYYSFMDPERMKGNLA